MHLGECSWEDAHGRRYLRGCIWEEASGGGIWDDFGRVFVMALRWLWQAPISIQWEGSGIGFGGLVALVAPGVAGIVSLQILAPLRNGMQKFNVIVAFTMCFFMVPDTKYGVWLHLRIPGSGTGSPDPARGLYQHRQNPTS
jgi:hypothetical protein